MQKEEAGRNNKHKFIQMNNMGTNSNTEFNNLQILIKSCMDSLLLKKQYILSIQNIKNASNFTNLLIVFKQKHNQFLALQTKLFNLIKSPNQTRQWKQKINKFIKQLKIQEIQTKISKIHKEKLKQGHKIIQNSKRPNQGNQILLYVYEQSLDQRFLEEQEKQMKIIQKLVSGIKNTALKTSDLIYDQSTNLNLASGSIKTTKTNLQQTNTNLKDVIQYWPNTDKNKICISIILIVIVTIIIIMKTTSKQSS